MCFSVLGMTLRLFYALLMCPMKKRVDGCGIVPNAERKAGGTRTCLQIWEDDEPQHCSAEGHGYHGTQSFGHKPKRYSTHRQSQCFAARVEAHKAVAPMRAGPLGTKPIVDPVVKEWQVRLRRAGYTLVSDRLASDVLQRFVGEVVARDHVRSGTRKAKAPFRGVELKDLLPRKPKRWREVRDETDPPLEEPRLERGYVENLEKVYLEQVSYEARIVRVDGSEALISVPYDPAEFHIGKRAWRVSTDAYVRECQLLFTNMAEGRVRVDESETMRPKLVPTSYDTKRLEHDEQVDWSSSGLAPKGGARLSDAPGPDYITPEWIKNGGLEQAVRDDKANKARFA
jgi:hypothetical protein